MIGNLGHNNLVDAVDAVEQGLRGESLSLLDLLSESLDAVDGSDVLVGLSALILSSMSGVEGAGQVPGGNLMSMGSPLVIGAGLLMVDRCCSSYSTHGREALDEGFEDLGRPMGLGMPLEDAGKVLFRLIH